MLFRSVDALDEFKRLRWKHIYLAVSFKNGCHSCLNLIKMLSRGSERSDVEARIAHAKAWLSTTVRHFVSFSFFDLITLPSPVDLRREHYRITERDQFDKIQEEWQTRDPNVSRNRRPARLVGGGATNPCPFYDNSSPGTTTATTFASELMWSNASLSRSHSGLPIALTMPITMH